nr:hypothetical protein [uncultured Dyadobacter sp.]
MKALIITVLACLIRLSGSAQTPIVNTMETELKKRIALACKLTDKEQIKRMNELHQTLFKKVSQVVEHPNSYELIFEHANNPVISNISEFIRFERQCCPWLIFRLTFQPDEGPVSLEMGDSQETKQMVYLVMKLDELHKANLHFRKKE